VSDAPQSDAAAGVSFTKYAPEIVIPSLCKAVREAQSSFEAIAEANHESWWMRDVAAEALRDIASILEEKGA